MKPEEEDFVLTDLNQGLFDAGQLTEKWKNEPREGLERLLRKNAKFHQARTAIKCLLDEIVRREQGDGRTDALSLAAALERRVGSIEKKMPPPARPEWRTWAFWMALTALIIAGWALLRDYFGWQHPPAPDLPSDPAHSRNANPVSHPPDPAIPATPSSAPEASQREP